MNGGRCFLFFVFSLWSFPLGAQPPKVEAVWALLYYMPYDNNLSSFADSVQNMIGNGAKSRDVVATLLRDDEQHNGIQYRNTFRPSIMLLFF